jgi:hypothetical protein
VALFKDATLHRQHGRAHSLEMEAIVAVDQRRCLVSDQMICCLRRETTALDAMNTLRPSIGS